MEHFYLWLLLPSALYEDVSKMTRVAANHQCFSHIHMQWQDKFSCNYHYSLGKKLRASSPEKIFLDIHGSIGAEDLDLEGG